MPTLREYFESEASRRLDEIEQLTNADHARDGAALRQHARALRGAIQMAGRDQAYRAALGLESALRSITEQDRPWSEDVREKISLSIDDLRRLIATDDGADADAAVAAVLERCLALGIESQAAAAPDRNVPDAAEDEASRAFRAFAQVEVASIADTMDTAIDAFTNNAMDREPLRQVLRRQRALLGSARIDEIPILGETLRAVEDLAAVIAKIDVAVKHEWLEVFRTGRDVLRHVHERLVEGEEPTAITALSKLRTLRDELLDRHGPAESVSTAAQSGPGLVQAVRAGDATTLAGAPALDPATAPLAQAPASSAPAGAGDAGPAGGSVEAAAGAAALDAYARAALRGALDLRARIEAGMGDDADARAALDEVFDLIRAALG